MDDIKIIKEEIEKLKSRNKKVELDKAWETSIERKVGIVIVTYIFISAFMYFADIERPFLNAVVPSIGFILSTLTLSIIKSFWIKSRKEK